MWTQDFIFQNIVICNVGLVNGCSQESIVSLFMPFGSVQQVIMLPHKSFCFAQFYDKTSAIKAYNAVHGKEKTSQDTIFLLSFSENGNYIHRSKT